jgi:competence/damage-inducible protein CinA-like protein
MKAEIIAIGSELLLGETIDTNSAFLARQLTGIGVNLFRKSVVGDNETRIANTILEALDRADLVICTGGLGPTVDDVTREAVARALGRPLEFHQHLLDQIETRFRSFGRTMSESNRRQAYAPQGACIVENPKGTAPSFIVEDERGTVIVLPGVPSEMRYLWEHAILPYLRDERGQTSVILVRTLHATGQGESVIGEMIADLMEQSNPTVGISAKRARYELRIGAKGNSSDEANALIDQAEAIIRERLGPYLIGDAPLEQTVLHLLREQGLSLALSESGARTPVYRALTDTPDAADVVRGALLAAPGVSVTDDAVQALAREGAQAARERWGTSLGLGIQAAATPGADGFTLVAAALVHPDGVHEWERRYDLSLEEGWSFISTLALDGLRRHLVKDER